MSDCLFCGIVRGEVPADVVHRDDHVVVFKDIRPTAPVHLLVVPVKHIESLASAGAEDEALLGRLLLAARKVASDAGVGHGFRTVINTGRGSGQAVFHVHVHVIGGRRMGWPP